MFGQVHVGLLLQAAFGFLEGMAAQTGDCHSRRNQACQCRQRVVVSGLVLAHCLLHGIVCQVTGHVLNHSGASGRANTTASGQGVCATTSHSHHLHGTQAGHVGQRINRFSDEASGQPLPCTGFFDHLAVGALLGEVGLAAFQVSRGHRVQQVLVLVWLIEALHCLLPVHVDGCAEDWVGLVVLRVSRHALHHVPDWVEVLLDGSSDNRVLACAPKRAVVDDGLLGEVPLGLSVGPVLVDIGGGCRDQLAKVRSNWGVPILLMVAAGGTEPCFIIGQVILAALAGYTAIGQQTPRTIGYSVRGVDLAATSTNHYVTTQHTVQVVTGLSTPVGLVGAAVVGHHRVVLVTVSAHVLLHLHCCHSQRISEVERVELSTSPLGELLLDAVELLEVPLGLAPLCLWANHRRVCTAPSLSTPHAIQYFG